MFIEDKINVEMTYEQLEFMIDRIHVDNSFRKYLEGIIKNNNKK